MSFTPAKRSASYNRPALDDSIQVVPTRPCFNVFQLQVRSRRYNWPTDSGVSAESRVFQILQDNLSGSSLDGFLNLAASEGSIDDVADLKCRDGRNGEELRRRVRSVRGLLSLSFTLMVTEARAEVKRAKRKIENNLGGRQRYAERIDDDKPGGNTQNNGALKTAGFGPLSARPSSTPSTNPTAANTTHWTNRKVKGSPQSQQHRRDGVENNVKNKIMSQRLPSRTSRRLPRTIIRGDVTSCQRVKNK